VQASASTTAHPPPLMPVPRNCVSQSAQAPATRTRPATRPAESEPNHRHRPIPRRCLRMRVGSSPTITGGLSLRSRPIPACLENPGAIRGFLPLSQSSLHPLTCSLHSRLTPCPSHSTLRHANRSHHPRWLGHEPQSLARRRVSAPTTSSTRIFESCETWSV